MVRLAIPGAPAQIYHANGRRGRDTFHITRLCAGGFTMEVHKLGPTVVATNGRSGAALEGVLWSPESEGRDWPRVRARRASHNCPPDGVRHPVGSAQVEEAGRVPRFLPEPYSQEVGT